jgi:hypothetical protein
MHHRAKGGTILAEGDDFERRLLLSVDAKGYGASTDRWQAMIQQGLLKVLDEAAERAGLNRAGWLKQGAGDGELSILPTTEPEPRVADDFVRNLKTALHRHNRDLTGTKRLRLRLAVHYGIAIEGPNGHRGAGPVVVSRLCDCPQLKAALATSGADLAVIVSRQVFTETIVEEHTSLEPGTFRKVRVQMKEYDDDAWIWVPDHDVHKLDLPDGPASPADTSGPPSGAADRGAATGGSGNFTGASIRAGTVIGGNQYNDGAAGP